MHGFFFRRWALISLLVGIHPVAMAQEPDTTAAVDSLLQELEREMAATQPLPQQAAPRTRPSTNPDISVIGDARAWYVSEGPRNVDAELHEIETAFRSVVDAASRGVRQSKRDQRGRDQGVGDVCPGELSTDPALVPGGPVRPRRPAGRRRVERKRRLDDAGVVFD